MQNNPPESHNLADCFSYVKQELNNLYRTYPELETLSKRELEVFIQLLTDKSLGEIAEELYITYSSVHFHCKNIYRKLDLSGRRQLLVHYKDI